MKIQFSFIGFWKTETNNQLKLGLCSQGPTAPSLIKKKKKRTLFDKITSNSDINTVKLAQEYLKKKRNIYNSIRTWSLNFKIEISMHKKKILKDSTNMDTCSGK